MKKTFVLTVTLLLFYSSGFSQAMAKTPDGIIGIYWSPKKDAKLEIYKKGDRYFGRSVWVAAAKKDSKNPDASLQNREVLGIELLTDFRYQDGTYTAGKVYDPESGKTYDCKISWSGDDLKVRGYIGISLFGRTEIFQRIKIH